jgi:adenylate cyclase
LVIDDSNAGAHHLLSQIFLNQRRYEQAIASAEKAVALQPSHALHTLFLGLNLVFVGRAEEGLELAKRAMRLSPLSPGLFLRILGLAYHSTGDHGEAITVLERARARTPSSPFVYIYLAMTYSGAGREEEARAAVAELLRRQPVFSVKRVANAIFFKDPAEQIRALDDLRKAGLPETSRSTAP